MAEAKIQETLNEYNEKIEEAKNYIDYLPLEGKKLVENYEKNLDNRKTLLNKAVEDKSFFETLTDEQVFNLLRICQALIKKFELVIKEDNNMIEKKNNLDKAMLLLEEFGDEKSQKAIREYKNGKRRITSVQLTRKIIEKPQGGSIHLWGRFFVIAGKPFLKFSMFEKYNGNF